MNLIIHNSIEDLRVNRALVLLTNSMHGTQHKFGNLRTLVLIFILFGHCSIAQIPPGYYDSAQGLTGAQLRTALFNIIDGHSVKSYASLWSHFQSTDSKSGLVWDMYSDVPSGSPNYIYQFGSDQCGIYAAEGDCYNREHSVPQSWFNSASPMQSDLFHVYPTDGYVNGQRSNYPYGEVSNPFKTSSNGSKSGPCSYPGYTGTVFEPIDEYKGDFARSYFYMMTRYKNNITSWSAAMFSGNNFSTWANDMLLSWHKNDSVDQKEIDRNNAVYSIQGNRNPFIDSPNWVDSIWVQLVSIPALSKPKIEMWVFKGSLQIQIEPPVPISLKVFNMHGAVVLQEQVASGLNLIDLPSASGFYFVCAIVDEEIHTLKILKE